MSTSPTPRGTRRLSTRALLIIAAFGALGALLLILVAPVTALLAALFPPAYALAAGVHSILPFLARRLVGFPWTTTIAFALVGLLAIGFTPLGALILIPLVVAGVGFDITLLALGRRGRLRPWHYAVGALVTAVLLFLVSLPVMSPDDLAAPILLLTLLGRVLSQLAAAGIAWLLGDRVLRAGIMRAPTGDRGDGAEPALRH
ncbi:hypothetical protein SAMN04515691_0221 [Leifsonia sp. 98AMF]|uniref:hypothetical protein n=1 Tax=unclassified Leifsonia TaxID=2663824 RepID=UPI00087B87DF|nr:MULTISPECIES: hypothetical protein [unclassified Leifsonia]SDH71314.1 hypothetical protein SAMN04515690_3799 [Leifsonia sp. 197AMF]SDJ50814.1 hypothetical protein SAMN04515684_4004 [Leifsonia sp. 466MF]SDK23418.1 hypothetical protein SAMN04515683_2761 [Leifsonia sp. 157MF]SDN70738.1 hypothetical protein SAMN04515686_2191 [Leifsonia sp. 509MF]SEN37579.1 hypothetical protein SAMN04515685_2745 [Leifsonia sp. 467MF]